MKTYNFEQAMEGLAHGIPVKKLSEPYRIITLDSLVYWFGVSLDDFYATDWVDASELIEKD